VVTVEPLHRHPYRRIGMTDLEELKNLEQLTNDLDDLIKEFYAKHGKAAISLVRYNTEDQVEIGAVLTIGFGKVYENRDCVKIVKDLLDNWVSENED